MAPRKSDPNTPKAPRQPRTPSDLTSAAKAYNKLRSAQTRRANLLMKVAELNASINVLQTEAADAMEKVNAVLTAPATPVPIV